MSTQKTRTGIPHLPRYRSTACAGDWQHGATFISTRASDVPAPSRAWRLAIECKSFRGSKAQSKVLDKLIRFGRSSSAEPDQLNGFTVPYHVVTSIPGWPPNASFSVNEYRRSLQKGIEEKIPQLLAGKCNLIAFNSDLFVGDVERFRATLRMLLGIYQQVSGLLVIRTEHGLPGDPFKLLGSAYAIELIMNQQAFTAIPTDLLQTIRPQVIRIALRS